MSESEAFVELVERVYETVDAPDRWRDVLAELADRVGGSRGCLFTPARKVEEGGLWSSYRLPAEQLIGYFTYYYQTDLWTLRAAELDLPTGLAVDCDKLVPAAVLEKSEWYNDFLKHVDIRGALSIMLGGGRPSYPRVHLSIYRSVGSSEFTTRAEALMQGLAPHLNRALDLGFRFNMLRNRLRDQQQVLNRLEYGVLMLDRRGRIIFRNKTAEKILAAADGLSVSKRRLVAGHPTSRDCLCKLVNRIVESRGDGSRSAGGSLSVPRPSAKRDYGLTVSPAAGAASMTALRNAAALVFITDPEQDRRPEAERMADLFGLTPAEARLAEALVLGHSLRSYADKERLSIHTVRTTLKHVFSKTRTRSQSALIRLLLANCVPAHGRLHPPFPQNAARETRGPELRWKPLTPRRTDRQVATPDQPPFGGVVAARFGCTV